MTKSVSTVAMSLAVVDAMFTFRGKTREESSSVENEKCRDE